MILPLQITLNSISMIFVGFVLIALGVLLTFSPAFRLYCVGFFFTGFGSLLFGITNGFTNLTPFGQTLYRLGLTAFIIGIPSIGYFLYNLI